MAAGAPCQFPRQLSGLADVTAGITAEVTIASLDFEW